MSSEESDIFTCSKCSKHISQKHNLIRHEKNCTNRKGNVKGVSCPDCDLVFGRLDTLRVHVQDSHNIDLGLTSISFKTKKEFEKWKTDTENENSCFYYKRRSVVVDGTTRTYLYCNRGGVFISKSKGHRRVKSQGTNKMNAMCTSGMVVEEDRNGSVDVVFCQAHFGHGTDSGRCYSAPEERTMTAGITSSSPCYSFLEEMMSIGNLTQSEEALIVMDKNRSIDEKTKEDILRKLDVSKEMLMMNEYTEEEYSKIVKLTNTYLDLVSKKREKEVQFVASQ